MPPKPRTRTSALGGAALAAALCIGVATAKAERNFSVCNAQLVELQWDALDGWRQDDPTPAYAAFLRSCKAIRASAKKTRAGKPMLAALFEICPRALAHQKRDADEVREFFEANFKPVRISALGETQGFLTGYYEPIVQGSKYPSTDYTVPVYRPPATLVVAGKKRGGEFPSSGAKVGRLVAKRKTVPFHDRTAIEEGALAGRGLEICYLKDPVDHFFAQIQGSTRVQLDTGKTLRLNYAAHNGLPYTPVGRFLVERGIVSRDEMSMDKIRAYMAANPDEGRELRRKNRSFVFFRETGLGDDDEPVGAQGVQLTAGHSIAVDKNLHVYGTPFWIEAELPIASEKPETRFRRLMVAQDTGSAIIGPARADIYFGSGEEAGSIAGRIKQPARFVMMVPKGLPLAPPEKIPLPRPRPADAVVAAQPEPGKS